MELTSYLTKSTHSVKWLVSLIKMFPLIVYADGKVDSWTLSPGYSLLNEMTNVKSIFKYNMNSRLYKMSSEGKQFLPWD